MKGDPKKAKLPKAYRDAFIRAPSTARDPEAVAGWLTLARLLLGMAVVATLSWLRFHDPLGNAALALAVAVVGTLVVFAPARWFVTWFVPRGRPRAAFRVMRVVAGDEERCAAAVAVAALSLAELEPGHPAVASELPFLEEQLSGAEPRGSEGVLAYALLRALRGDHESARALFGWMVAAPRSIFSGFARRVARTWLSADHLRCGEREQARELLNAGRSGALDWLSRPSRALRRLANLAAAPPSPTLPQSRAAGDALQQALDAHRFWLVAGPSLGASDRDAALLHAGRAWDAVTHAEHTALLETATSDLATSTMHAGVSLAPFSGQHRTLDRAYDLVAEQLFTAVTERLEALRRRVDAAHRGTELEEWLEWAALQQTIARAQRLGGERVRRGTFAGIYSEVTHYAVWLYNERRLYLLGHALFRWLLAEARFMNDDEAIRLCWKNSNIRPD